MYKYLNGFFVTSNGIEDVEPIDDMKTPSRQQIELCKEWITRHCIGCKALQKYSFSYGAKHEAEGMIGEYVSNGALISAAIELGIPVERIPNSFNARLGFICPSQKWQYVRATGFTRWLFAQYKNSDCHPWIKYDLAEDVKVDSRWPRRCKTLSEICEKVGSKTIITLAWMMYKQILPNLSWNELTWNFKVNNIPQKLSGVYIIKAETTSFFKIGKTSSVKDRVAQLQAACPHRLILYAWIPYPFAHQLERATHNEFCDNRHRNEWFEFATPEKVYWWFDSLQKALEVYVQFCQKEDLYVDKWHYGEL